MLSSMSSLCLMIVGGFERERMYVIPQFVFFCPIGELATAYESRYSKEELNWIAFQKIKQITKKLLGREIILPKNYFWTHFSHGLVRFEIALNILGCSWWISPGNVTPNVCAVGDGTLGKIGSMTDDWDDVRLKFLNSNGDVYCGFTLAEG